MFKANDLIKATGGKLICGRADSSLSGVSIDSRAVKPGELFIAIKGEKFDGHDFIVEAVNKGAGCVIYSGRRPAACGSRAAFIQHKDTLSALGAVGRFWRRGFDIPVVAVTGSNGKTTTKDMVAAVLSVRYRTLKNQGTRNNAIGLPLTLLKLRRGDQAAVLELGTNHFGEIACLARTAEPGIGIITNIAAAHLKYFGSLRGVMREKVSLLAALKSPRLALVNADDRFLARASSLKGQGLKVLSFGINSPADFSASGLKLLPGGWEFTVNRKHKFRLKSFGRHNIYNALAAIACGRLLGVSYRAMRDPLHGFDFPAGRMNYRLLNQVGFIDDTYNSNPFSLQHALDTLALLSAKGRRILMMGDMLELGRREESFHIRAGQAAAGVCDVLITVGALSRLAAEAARGSGLAAGSVFCCENSRQARQVLKSRVAPKKGDLVLVKGSRLMKMEEVFRAL